MTITIQAEGIMSAIDKANYKRQDFANDFFSKKFKNLEVYSDVYDNGLRCWGEGIGAFIAWLNKKGLDYEIMHDNAGHTGVFWYSWEKLLLV